MRLWLAAVEQPARGGWTPLDPAIGARVVYVSTSDGKSTNDGLTPKTPVITLAQGVALLREMLLCPLMWYGNAREHDMDFGQFCIMFRAIFLEGFARPFAGVRLILKNLVRKFRGLGGELRLNAHAATRETSHAEIAQMYDGWLLAHTAHHHLRCNDLQ